MSALPIVDDAVLIDRLVPTDAEALAHSRSDPGNARFQGWQSPLSREEALEFIAAMADEVPFAPGCSVQLAIREVRDGPLVGDLYVARDEVNPQGVELGITLAPQCHGKGIAAAAIRSVAAAVLGADVGGCRIDELVAIIDIENTRSIALFERVGFRLDRRLAGTSTRRDGSVADELVFAQRRLV